MSPGEHEVSLPLANEIAGAGDGDEPARAASVDRGAAAKVEALPGLQRKQLEKPQGIDATRCLKLRQGEHYADPPDLRRDGR